MQSLEDKIHGCDDMYSAILVATPREAGPDGSAVGVVEVYLASRDDVMDRLPALDSAPGAAGKLWGHGWLSSIAVSGAHRRRGCARALVAAAEQLVANWGYSWAALHVDGDNASAVGLYEGRGWSHVAEDRSWLRLWRRRIVLMAKKVT